MLALALALALLLPTQSAGQDPPPAAPAKPPAATADGHSLTPYLLAAIGSLAGAVAYMWRTHSTEYQKLVTEVEQRAKADASRHAAEVATTRVDGQRALELAIAAHDKQVAALRVELDRERADCRKQLDELRDRVDQEQAERRVEAAQLLREQQTILREVVVVCDSVKHVVDKSTNTINELASRFDQ